MAPKGGPVGPVRLEVIKGHNIIKLWRTSTKGEQNAVVVGPDGWERPQSSLPGFLYVEGIECGDAHLRLTHFDPNGIPLTSDDILIRVTRLALDLELEGVGEEDEEVPGGLVGVNADDDDGDGRIDGDDDRVESLENDVHFDDDLWRLTLRGELESLPSNGSLVLRVESGYRRVKLWRNRNRTGSVGTYSRHDLEHLAEGIVLWLEGATPGPATLGLSYCSSTGVTLIGDRIRVTVCSAYVDTDSNNDGNLLRRWDDAIEMNEPGRLVWLNKDDDNGNGTPDWRDGTGGAPDDDLALVQLSVWPSYLPATATLDLGANGRHSVKLWTTSRKDEGTEIHAPRAFDLRTSRVPPRLYVEGLREGPVTLSLVVKDAEGREVTRDEIAMRVVDVTVDLDLGGLSESQEEDPGAFLDVNGDLQMLTLQKMSSRLPGHDTVRLTYRDHLKVWQNRARTSDVDSGTSFRLSELQRVQRVLWLEAEAGGSSPVTLTYSKGASKVEDTLMVHVRQIDLATDSNHNGRIAASDDVIEDQAPGRIIGLNDDEVIVGNIGAEGKKMEYTVIGDAVNLGARTEALTRRYDTHILVTEFTYKKIRDHVHSRRIGHCLVQGLEIVRVKGKERPVKIFKIASLEHGTESVIREEPEPQPPPAGEP